MTNPNVCVHAATQAALEVDPLGGSGYVGAWTTCEPPLIPPIALKQWGPPRRQG